MPKFDYTSIGFITFDCLGRPVENIPPNGDTYFIEELTLAVSGAAGSAVVVAAKHGLTSQAVGGIGPDDMGVWVIDKLNSFGIDTSNMAQCPGFATSSSIVTTRSNGARPALHKLGATAGFTITDDQLDRVTDTKILHVGGVGLMNRMDESGRTAEVMKVAKERGAITTLDVFAATRDDMALVAPLLPHTDFFLPSEEEAVALSGLLELEEVAKFLIDQGTGAVVLTLGENGAMYRDSQGVTFDMPAFKVDVVCTCGCGDCFNAGFAIGLHLGKTMEDCVRLGQAVSAQNATGLGSQAGVRDLNTTFRFMDETPTR